MLRQKITKLKNLFTLRRQPQLIESADHDWRQYMALLLVVGAAYVVRSLQAAARCMLMGQISRPDFYQFGDGVRLCCIEEAESNVNQL